MKKIIVISSLVFVLPFSIYAEEERRKTEAPPPPRMQHHMMMPHPSGRRGMMQHRMMMPRKNSRLKSELHIRALLSSRYYMSEEDMAIILKARQEILDVMQKYAPPLEDGSVPPPPIF